VGEDDVLDIGELRATKREAETAGVNGDGVVDQETGQRLGLGVVAQRGGKQLNVERHIRGAAPPPLVVGEILTVGAVFTQILLLGALVWPRRYRKIRRFEIERDRKLWGGDEHHPDRDVLILKWKNDQRNRRVGSFEWG